jgi:hypothetical protein
MAELQWVIEVRCVNTLLAEVKVGERGQHFCQNVPNRQFDPAEFNKLIEGLKEARRIAKTHRKTRKTPTLAVSPTSAAEQVGRVVEIENRSDLYEVEVLSSGELVTVNVPGSGLFAPSELDRFIADLKAIRNNYAVLRDIQD